MTFDVENALRIVAAARHGDPIAVETARLAEQVADGFRRDFGDTLDLETCGRALVIASASLVPLCSEEIPGAVLVNLVAMAGESLVRRERAVRS